MCHVGRILERHQVSWAVVVAAEVTSMQQQHQRTTRWTTQHLRTLSTMVRIPPLSQYYHTHHISSTPVTAPTCTLLLKLCLYFFCPNNERQVDGGVPLGEDFGASSSGLMRGGRGGGEQHAAAPADNAAPADTLDNGMHTTTFTVLPHPPHLQYSSNNPCMYSPNQPHVPEHAVQPVDPGDAKVFAAKIEGIVCLYDVPPCLFPVRHAAQIASLLSFESLQASFHFHLFTISAAELLKIHDVLYNTVDVERALFLLREKYDDHPRFWNTYEKEWLVGDNKNWNRAVRPSG